MESFNSSLWEKAENDRLRPHYQKGTLIAELYTEDKEHFLQLPAKEFECVQYEQVKADKYGYIRVDNKLYSTSPRFAKKMVLARISYE
nr:hypothetical protein [Bacillus methanolicus]